MGCSTTLQATCQTSFRSSFPALHYAPPIKRSECVPASEIEPSFRDDTPVCRCVYEVEAPYSDTPPSHYDDSFTLGMARRRALIGEAGDTCERRIDYWGAPGVCLLEAEDFAGCSLRDRTHSCESACKHVTESNLQTGIELWGHLELLAIRPMCCGDPVESASAYCVGAFRVNDQCGVGVQDQGISLYEMSCDQSIEQMLQGGLDAFLPPASETTCREPASISMVDAGGSPGKAGAGRDGGNPAIDAGIPASP
jgi:hypothetical protein